VRYPDIICLGAQKTATTWLYRALRGRTDIYVPPIKELHYFSQLYNQENARRYGPPHRAHQVASVRKYLEGKPRRTPEDEKILAQLDHLARADVDDDWYAEIFAPAPADAVCMDICPGYMNIPIAAVQHAFRLNPVVRLFLIVRDPVDRCWSHIRMIVAQGGLDRDVTKLASPDAPLARFLSYTEYAESIRRWRAFAAPGQFKLMLYDDLVANPENTMVEIFKFAGLVRRRDRPLPKEVFKGEEIEMPKAVRVRLLEELAPQYEYLRQDFPDAVQRWLDQHAVA
jgi:hypothetical protein